jgi:hypothetical protein
MKLFKTLREEALEKVKNAKVFADKKSADNEKDSAFSKKGQEAKSDSGELEYGTDKNKVHVTEAAIVKTGKYSWGTMKTVHHGSDFSIPLHPEHQEAISKLKDEQEHKFKDETGHHWVARRKGDDIHFDTTGNGSMKTHVPMKHITEAAPVAPAPVIHRIGVTVSDPDGQAVSKRSEKIQKFVRVHHHNDNKEEAIARGKKHFEKKGWKVHDAWHAGNVHESVNEDIDRAYADWQDSVKKKNPEHADKIKFKSNSDQRHVISAEHGDRSFGTFNMKTGESEHLGEALDNKAALRAKMAEHEAKALEANKQGDDEMVKHHQDKINKIKTKMANLIRNEELELDETRSLEDKIKVAKEIYAEKLKSATSPADRAQAKEDHENLIKKLSESESLDEAHEYMWKIEGGIGKGKVFGDKSTTVDDHLSAMKYHSQEYQKAVEEKRNTDAQRHGMKYHKHKDQIERLGDVGNYRKEEVELDEVSKTTLVSYIKKAAKSAAEAGNEAGFKAGVKQPKYNVSDETPTEIKRHKGIALAARKLSK